jgi:adenylate kinase
MVSQQIVGTVADGTFILDGYPRTAQIRHLDLLLATLDQPAPAVVALCVRPDELIQRLANRARNGDRSDDTEAIVRERQAVYQAQTAPLPAIYRRRGVLREVDGSSQVTDVARRIEVALSMLSAILLRKGA